MRKTIDVVILGFVLAIFVGYVFFQAHRGDVPTIDPSTGKIMHPVPDASHGIRYSAPPGQGVILPPAPAKAWYQIVRMKVMDSQFDVKVWQAQAPFPTTGLQLGLLILRSLVNANQPPAHVTADFDETISAFVDPETATSLRRAMLQPQMQTINPGITLPPVVLPGVPQTQQNQPCNTDGGPMYKNNPNGPHWATIDPNCIPGPTQ